MSALSSRRYLSVWLRRLATDRIARRSSAPPDAPLAVVTTIDQALRITALNDAAARLRLTAGMALADARAMYPDLPVVDADEEADRRLLVAIADWCDRYTPLVGLDPPDGLLLDITGCVHLFHGEMALARDLLRRLALQGFQARVAIADTVGCAWAMARYPVASSSAVRDATDKICIVQSGHEREALAPLPLAALRLAPDTVAALTQVGLKRIVDVMDKPRAPLAARFGAGFLRLLDRALGHEDEPIVPRLPVPTAIVERRFPDPIAYEEDVLGTIEQLAGDLARMLERRGEGARVLQLALFRADGKVHRLEIGTAAPLRDPKRIRRLFTDRLAALGDACDPGFGYDMVRLSAIVTERSAPPQVGFDTHDTDDAELAHLIDRLGARFGLRRVTRLEPQDTHIPEYAVAAVPAHAPRPKAARVTRESGAGSTLPPRALASGGEGRREAPGWGERLAHAEHDIANACAQDSLAPLRPIRLFARPEPVDVTALVPDGPPIRFRWRHVMHEIARSEGPERIAMEWWHDTDGTPLTRDYFRVEDHSGMRAWLYREGLFGRDAVQPRWFLHGLFA